MGIKVEDCIHGGDLGTCMACPENKWMLPYNDAEPKRNVISYETEEDGTPFKSLCWWEPKAQAIVNKQLATARWNRTNCKGTGRR